MMIFPHINGEEWVTIRPKLNVAAERSIDFPTRAFVRLLVCNSVDNNIRLQLGESHDDY